MAARSRSNGEGGPPRVAIIMGSKNDWDVHAGRP